VRFWDVSPGYLNRQSLHTTSVLAICSREPYLLTSTALSDLRVFAGTS
jgi:hypothetical protein